MNLNFINRQRFEQLNKNIQLGLKDYFDYSNILYDVNEIIYYGKYEWSNSRNTIPLLTEGDLRNYIENNSNGINEIIFRNEFIQIKIKDKNCNEKDFINTKKDILELYLDVIKYLIEVK